MKDSIAFEVPQSTQEEFRRGIYRHFKGNLYLLLGIATHSETRERMVVYQALYGDYSVWVRPAAMWTEMVERDGKVFQRFTYIGEENTEISAGKDEKK